MMYTISNVTFTKQDTGYEVLLIVQLGDEQDTLVSGTGITQAAALCDAAKRVEKRMLELQRNE